MADLVSLEIPLSTDTEAMIREHAAASGQDMETFVLQAVAEKLAAAEVQQHPVRGDKHWVEKLRACIDLHPVAAGPADDRRESIYAGRGA